jgi:hypothetical protein
MKRACIIGNSHASSLKIALDRRYKPEDADIATYLIPGRAEPRLRLVEGGFRPEAGINAVRTDLGDLSETGLDIQQFDALLISALGIMPPTDAFLDNGECPIGVAAMFGYESAENMPHVSLQFMEHLVREKFTQSGGYKLLLDIAKTYSGVVAIQKYPHPSSAILDAADNGLNKRFGPRAQEVLDAFATLRDRVISREILKVLPTAHILDIPAECLASPGFIKPEFQRTNDPWHTNEICGEMLIRQFAAVM